MKNRYCILMAGGIGSRFWPMSTSERPKQFLDILGTGKTLIQQTFERLTKVCPSEQIYIVTNAQYKNLVLEQLEVREDQVISEPSRRNTAPCIAYASYKIAKLNPDANIIVAPSDHLILKEDSFTEIVDIALAKTASTDCLITLGIKPSRPDTGYGYIQFDNEAKDKKDKIRHVRTFTEKPDLKLAKTFLESGDFYWNSGIFLWSVRSIIKALEQHLPEVNALFKEGIDKYNTKEEADFIVRTYERCKNISIDYGIMEKADNVFVVLSDFGWSDLGTWGSLYENLSKNDNDNAIVGKKVYMYNSKNCIVNVPNDRLVVLQGLDDYIVVESQDTLLVCKKEDEQQIKQMVNDIKSSK